MMTLGFFAKILMTLLHNKEEPHIKIWIDLSVDEQESLLYTYYKSK